MKDIQKVTEPSVMESIIDSPQWRWKRNLTLIAQSEPLEIMYLFLLVICDCSLRGVWYSWVGFCRIMRCLQWMCVPRTAVLQWVSNSPIISWETDEWETLYNFASFLHKVDIILNLSIWFLLSSGGLLTELESPSVPMAARLWSLPAIERFNDV